MKPYPRIGDIYTMRPQGTCKICGTVLLDGKKPDRRVCVEWNIFRGDDTVYKVHRKCLAQSKKDNSLLGKLIE